MTYLPNAEVQELLVAWPWPAVLFAHVEHQVADASSNPDGNLLFMAPTSDGLDALEMSEQHLSGLWVLVAGQKGPGTLEFSAVEEISTWTTRTPGDRQLSVLHCPRGQMVAIQDDEVVMFRQASSDWKGSGPYKRL